MPFIWQRCLILCVLCTSCAAETLYVQAEGAGMQGDWRFRSNAMGGQSVLIRQGFDLILDFCLASAKTVIISSVLYSNDGPPDVVSIIIDGMPAGEFQTMFSQGTGQNWNIFQSGNILGNPVLLQAGNHTMKLMADQSDMLGVEIDAVVLETPAFQGERIYCDGACVADYRYGNYTLSNRDDIASIKLLQKSVIGQCAENNNIRVEAYHENIRNYRITARPPLLAVHANLAQQNFTNCDPVPTVIFDVGPGGNSIAGTAVRGTLNGPRQLSSCSQITLAFTTSGKDKGSQLSDIGSVLSVKLRKLSNPLEIIMHHLNNKSKLTMGESRLFLPNDTSHTWSFSDFTWSDKAENVIILRMSSTSAPVVDIENIKLTTRPLFSENVRTLFVNNTMIIGGAIMDFWWLAPRSMTIVRSDTGNTLSNVHYFNIFIARPSGQGFAQVFRMYQDGKTFLNNVPSSQFSTTPFGSSVLLGQTKPTDVLPSAPIAKVDINPGTLQMIVTYEDNSTCEIKLEPGPDETVVTVTNLIFAKSRLMHPFLTFQSMWVDNANNHVDSVAANENVPRNILLDGWQYLYGTSILFFRTCASNHNTLSPDIQLDVLTERDVLAG